jgi:hypothetical protein
MNAATWLAKGNKPPIWVRTNSRGSLGQHTNDLVTSVAQRPLAVVVELKPDCRSAIGTNRAAPLSRAQLVRQPDPRVSIPMPVHTQPPCPSLSGGIHAWVTINNRLHNGRNERSGST